MASRTESWKQKVDPAFVQFIKFSLEFLSVIQLLGNKGYLALDDKNLRTLEIEGFPSLASVYEHDNVKDALLDVGIIIDEPVTEEDLREIEKEIKKKKNAFSVLSELAEMMQKESSTYYWEAFEHLSSEETYNKYISGRKERKLER